MNDASQAITGMLGLWLMVQLVVLLVLLLGGLYALFCLSRAAAGLDRLAGAVEQLVEHEKTRNSPPLPGGSLSEVPMSGALRPISVPAVPPPPAAPPPTYTPPTFDETREEKP